MPKIKKLTEDVISKIAAGEVITDPSCVVKELLENSIDSGAENIDIVLHNAGLTEITVTDNGEGMEKEDLHECYKRHTTSKVARFSDIENIESLGFRGEALASIVSVSSVYIASRHKDSIEGNFLKIEGNDIVDNGLVGMPVGTKVSIKNLFQNLPARKKFLKSEGSELKKITDVILRTILSKPNLRVVVSHNGRELLNLPADKNKKERVHSVFKRGFNGDYVAVNNKQGSLKITGFITKPQASRGNRNKQFFYVNNRYVNSNEIADVIKKSYGNLLTSGRYPPFVLFFELPTVTIDVNVHPRKEKVRFLNQADVYSFLSESIRLALERADLTFIKQGYSDINELSLYEDDSEWIFDDSPSAEENKKSNVLQLHNLYIVKESKGGVVFYDQHAAHERILYEKFVKMYKNEVSKDSYSLENEVQLTLDASDFVVFEDNLDVFKSLGFLSKNTGDTYVITHAPKILKDRNIQKIIYGVIDDLVTFENVELYDPLSDRALSHLACRSAVRSGQKLSSKEINSILNDLEKTDTKYTCPHGRPVKVEISLEEINNSFKR